MQKSIVLINPEEISRRASRDEASREISMTDPISYVKSLIEELADESGIISRVEVSPEGRHGLRFYATLDMRKVNAIVREGKESRTN